MLMEWTSYIPTLYNRKGTGVVITINNDSASVKHQQALSVSQHAQQGSEIIKATVKAKDLYIILTELPLCHVKVSRPTHTKSA